jgi:hypothetical protein
MQHFIYKTTCLVTNKFYIGMHSTSRKNDTYLGSGNVLRSSIKKHGRENHRREILVYAPTREELRRLEESIVTRDLLLEPLCMNLALGGCGSGVGRKVTEKTRKIFSEQRKGWAHMDPEVRERHRIELSAKQSSRVGDKHPTALTWKVMSPDGEITVTKNFVGFCDEHGLAYSAFRNKRTSGNRDPITKGLSKGWSLLSVESSRTR